MTVPKSVIQPTWDEVRGAYFAGKDHQAPTREALIETVRSHHPEGAVIQFPDTDVYVPETLKQKPH